MNMTTIEKLIEEKAALNNEIGNLRERATHAEQAALEMAEENEALKRDLDILKAERELDANQKEIMREALEKLKQITEKGAYLNPLPRTTIRDIVLEALAKLKQ